MDVTLTRSETAPSSVIEPEGSSEQELLDAYVRRYFPMVYAACRRYTRNRHDAEDAAQAVFLCLAMQLRQQRVIHSPGAWLYQVACRTAQDLYRRRNTRYRHENARGNLRYSDHDEPDTAADMDMAELRPKVVEALNSLPVSYRLHLILFYFGGLTHEDLAKELKCTRGSLRVRLHRGHKMLKKVLEDQGVNAAGVSLSVVIGTAVQMEVSDSLLVSTTGLAHHASQFGLASCQLPADVLAAAAQTMGRPFRFKLMIALATGIAACAGSSPLLARFYQELPRLPELLSLPSIPRPSFLAPLFQMSDAGSSAGPAAVHSAARMARAGVMEVPCDSHALSSPAPARLAELPPITYQSLSSEPQFQSSVARADRGTVLLPVFIPSAAHAAEQASYSSPAAAMPASARASAGSIATATAAKPAPNNAPLVVTISPSSSSPWSHAHDTVEPRFGPGDESTQSATADAAAQERILVNNGQVISTSLVDIKDYRNFTAIRHDPSISANTPAGWFAMNGGEVLFPTLHIAAGTHSYVVGDDPSASRLDLINSVRLTIHDAQSDFDSNISLLAANSDGEVLNLPTIHGTLCVVVRNGLPALPESHQFFGVWSMDNSGIIAGGIDLTIRYDETAIAYNHLDESQTKLWYYTDAWHRITDDSFFRDGTNHLVGGHIPGDARFFAVSTPEPAAALALSLTAASLLLRRQRRH